MRASDGIAALRETLSKRLGWFAFAAFTAFFIWSSIDFNDKVPLDDWKHDLRADASGYYIYLPGLFHHGMRAATVPDSLREVAGLGFSLDREKDRIITKYTSGPAILMAPFFLIAEAIEGFGATDGWSRTHHRLIEAGAILYWSLGLFLMLQALQAWRPAPWGVALLVIGAVAFGTNTFYYAFRAPGYSHVYSFFLACLALHAALTGPPGALGPWRRILFLWACAMLVIIRPIDIIAVLGLLGLLAIRRPEELRRPSFHALGLVVGLLAALPQLLYWRFAFGQWVVYSYGDEGFTNWASPMLREVLFSPMNGLLPHAPALLLLPFGLFALWREDRRPALLILLVLLAAVYSFAAWHAWHFGCSYGMRPFVQYTPFAALALWPLLLRLREMRPPLYWGLVPLLVLVCFVNYRAMLQYDVCYPWEPWNWTRYGRNLWEAFFGAVPC